MAARMIHVPSDARLIEAPTAAEREKWEDFRGGSLSDWSLATYVIQIRVAHGADPAAVFTSKKASH